MALVALVLPLLLAATLQHAPDTPDLRNLRWVAGVVAASTPQSVTVRLTNRELTIPIDSTTDVVGGLPLPGSFAEVHYAERRGVRRAITVLPLGTGAQVSKKPRSSLRGTVTQIKRSNLSVRCGDRARVLALDKRSRLIGADGQALAIGSPDIAQVLGVNAEVLVKYEGDADVIVGDVTLYGGNDKVIEIRQLKSPPES